MILIKDQDEIQKVKAACQVVAQVFREIEGQVKAGISTLELDALIEGSIRRQGAQPAFKGYRGYKHASCLSVNAEVVHGIPGSRRLSEGDVVGVDIGALLNGFYGDAARTYAIGQVSGQARKLLRVGEECLELAIKQARAGRHLGDIGSAIERHAARAKFSVVRDLFGHGIGRSLHEDPLIPNFGMGGQGAELRPGMTLAIEPMVNAGGSQVLTLSDGWTVVTADNQLSVHFENTVLVTENDPEVLTK
ncbi:type I methionyl aminopeptidase [Candidatus Saganbacteria bacterium]|nr:type I methionyl aminopeptidase [Candidatus Saganbacteria bacterium]